MVSSKVNSYARQNIGQNQQGKKTFIKNTFLVPVEIERNGLRSLENQFSKF